MDLSHLTGPDRAERYREMAKQQLKLAAEGDNEEVRASCLELAAMWTRLAEEAERRGAEPGPGGPSV